MSTDASIPIIAPTAPDSSLPSWVIPVAASVGGLCLLFSILAVVAFFVGRHRQRKSEKFVPPPFFSRTETNSSFGGNTIGFAGSDQDLYQIIPAVKNPNAPDYAVGDLNPSERSGVHEMEDFGSKGSVSSHGMTFQSIASDKSS
jgi:hypothetical protein